MPRYSARAQRWAAIWGVPGLAGRTRIEWSANLRTSFARSFPKNKLVRLNPVLLKPSHRDLVPEVLCHELAHLAVYELFGPGRKPHGPEWQALVKKAGFSPSGLLGPVRMFPVAQVAVP
jgi:predicted SprT family Zn-dependent metalloprotease